MDMSMNNFFASKAEETDLKTRREKDIGCKTGLPVVTRLLKHLIRFPSKGVMWWIGLQISWGTAEPDTASAQRLLLLLTRFFFFLDIAGFLQPAPPHSPWLCCIKDLREKREERKIMVN
jgi:hypothetical protein